MCPMIEYIYANMINISIFIIFCMTYYVNMSLIDTFVHAVMQTSTLRESTPRLFVKLEKLHIATARKPLIHQNQPVAQYLHRNEPYMLYIMPVGLHHSAHWLKLSTGNEVISKFYIPADDTTCFWELGACTRCRLLHIALFCDNIHGGK